MILLTEKDMINVCVASNNSRVVVNFLDKDNRNNTTYKIEGAYVCKGTVCKGPIKDINKLGEELLN